MNKKSREEKETREKEFQEFKERPLWAKLQWYEIQRNSDARLKHRYNTRYKCDRCGREWWQVEDFFVTEIVPCHFGCSAGECPYPNFPLWAYKTLKEYITGKSAYGYGRVIKYGLFGRDPSDYTIVKKHGRQKQKK